MRYLALACDYDGTLATDGLVTERTIAALHAVQASGRKLILVTGRQLEDLQAIFLHLSMFDRIVAENGALLYRPAAHEEKVLATPPSEEFLWALRERDVWPLSVGRVIVATNHPHENAVLDAIRQLGLELQVIFNKGAVMILPSGVNKATGLGVALEELGLSPHNVVGVGDAENDHAFLRICECAVAVSTALPTLREQADYVTSGGSGAGIEELCNLIVTEDLLSVAPRLSRHAILLGVRENKNDDVFLPDGENILLAGSSGGGKSTFATGFLERLAEQHYQFCVIDPEGDYETLDFAVALGQAQSAPSIDEVLQLLESPANNVVVNLIGLPLSDRPGFFHALFPRLQEMRARTGRPHWILVDETHHLLSAAWEPAGMALSQTLRNMIFVTVHPHHLTPGVLNVAHVCIAVGQTPLETLAEVSRAVHQPLPALPANQTTPEEVLVWRRQTEAAPYWLLPTPNRTQRRRHLRKYAEGELEPERSFYFRGPTGALHLRAQNLVLFQQLAEGVDEATWLYHLQRGDYSHWFREGIKDESLAQAAEEIETNRELSAKESRDRIKEIIEERYTAPSETLTP